MTPTTVPRRGPVELFAGDDHEWDTFVRAQAGATFCHLAPWRHLIRDVMGHRPVYLVTRDEAGELSGVLPAFLLRSPLFGKRLISVPLLNYGGPLGTPESRQALTRALFREAERSGAGTVELRCREPVGPEFPSSGRKVTVLLDLPAEPELLWSRFKPKVRSQVRRPMKEGFTVRFGADQRPAFYDVFSHNMRDLGTPVLPAALFDRIAVDFPEESVFAVVYHAERPIAGAAGFVFNDEFEITWASALRAYSVQAPNMLLYWSLMEEMIRRGVRTFNFGRCTPGEGTHRFKLQWEGADLPLPWITSSSASAAGAEPGRAARRISAAWQRMPVGVTRLLGPAVARQLPWW